jgi:hypothetical protein
MANSPVDRNESLMQKDFGTRVLVTDPASDKYLEQSARQKKEKERLWRDNQE